MAPMLFNPEDGKTWEEIFEIVLRKLPPERRARFERDAAVSGLTIQELVEEKLAAAMERLKDPAYRAACDAQTEWEQQPYGADPLLRKARP
jgi:hypothetical protein